MTKEYLVKKVQSDIDVMIPGNEFDVRHLFGLTSWASYQKSDQELIASLFYELSQSEFEIKLACHKLTKISLYKNTLKQVKKL